MKTSLHHIRTYGEDIAFEDALNMIFVSQMNNQFGTGWALADGGGFAAIHSLSARTANDPTCSLRGDDDDSEWDNDEDSDNDEDWDQDEHQRAAAAFQRNLAAQQASMYRRKRAGKAADLHVKACTELFERLACGSGTSQQKLADAREPS